MGLVSGHLLLLYALLSILALVVGIARFKLNPLLALIVVSLALGLAVRMPMAGIVKSFETGMGNTLGHVALVVALGTMLGKLMAESGGAERIARTLIDAFGERRVHWAMAVVAFLVGLPVFFEVGFVLLIPIAFTVARRTGTSMILVGLPMVAGLSVVHGLVPPHPAALMAVNAYQANMGRTILYALVVGLPCIAIAGPLFAKLVDRHVRLKVRNPLMEEFVARAEGSEARPLPGFAVTLFTILLPVLLMLLGDGSHLFARPGSGLAETLKFIGNPVMALLLATLVSFYTFGSARGFNREDILRFTNQCLGPVCGVILVIGAGGGFGQILRDSGVSAAIVQLATSAHLSLLLLAWSLAALLRIATGSATVAMTTSASIVAPIAATLGGTRPELLVLATGAGSLILSHVNDGGFWLVKEYFHMTVPQTLQTWSVCETIISVVALLLTLALAAILPWP